jgi:hypothetical protein
MNSSTNAMTKSKMIVFAGILFLLLAVGGWIELRRAKAEKDLYLQAKSCLELLEDESQNLSDEWRQYLLRRAEKTAVFIHSGPNGQSTVGPLLARLDRFYARNPDMKRYNDDDVERLIARSRLDDDFDSSKP